MHRKWVLLIPLVLVLLLAISWTLKDSLLAGPVNSADDAELKTLNKYLEKWEKLSEHPQVEADAQAALEELVTRIGGLTLEEKQAIDDGLKGLESALQSGLFGGSAQRVIEEINQKFGFTPFTSTTALITEVSETLLPKRKKVKRSREIPFTQVRANQDPAHLPQNEVSVAVNPLDDKNVVVNGNDYRLASFGDVRVGVYVSNNGGQSFKDTLIQTSGFTSFDPSVAFDPQGNAYSSQNFVRFCPAVFFDVCSGIEVSKSTDKGNTWPFPVKAVESPGLTFTAIPPDTFTLEEIFIDKAYIAAGAPAGPENNGVYVTYTDFRTQISFTFDPITFDLLTSEFKITSQIRAVRSPDGVTWQNPVDVSPEAIDFKEFIQFFPTLMFEVDEPGHVVQGSNPWVASDGKLYVAWYDSLRDPGPGITWPFIEGWLVGEFSPKIASSTDGGINFSASSTIATKTELSGGIFLFGGLPRGFVLPPTLFRAWPTMFPVVRTSPEDSNVLYAVFGADPDSFPDAGFATNDDADIFFTGSNDGGLSWSDPIRVNDDPDINDQFFAWMAVQPKKGNIHVTFGDRREDESDTIYNVFHAVSTDGGLSFHPNKKVTAQPSNPNTQFSGFFLGDYFGLASSDKDVFAGWTDTRLEQNQDVFIGIARTGKLEKP